MPLTPDEIYELHATAIQLGLANSRIALMSGIDAGYVTLLPGSPSPSEQLLSDLGAMNGAGLLVDGTDPMQRWISNALRLSRVRRESVVFQRALDKLKGQPPPAVPAQSPPVPAASPATSPAAPSGLSFQAAVSSTPPRSSFPNDISGAEYQLLTRALAKAFPARRKMAMMLQFRLGKMLNDIAAEDIPLLDVAFEVIQTAKAEGWVLPLVLGAQASNPGNPRLIEFCQSVGLAPAMPSALDFERLVKSTNHYIDVDVFRQKLGEVEAQVCKVAVSLGGSSMNYGTGFLVGPDLLITNHHVLAPVIADKVDRSAVSLIFDYKCLAGGRLISLGTEYRLAATWLVDSSPPSAKDRLGGTGGDPDPSELDYALVRLERPIGEEPVGAKPEPTARPRKWIVPGAPNVAFPAGSPLFIVQHPNGEPIKLALDTEAILALNSNGTRVRYRTNTEPGSSGSPCFNQKWELVALHHMGDPDYSKDHPPGYNQGIPFAPIVDLLASRNIKLPPLPAE